MLNVEFDGPVVRLTLSRPDVRNALNDELIVTLLKEFRQLPIETRAVVLTGEGPAFCSGADLEWMRRAADYSMEQNYRDALVLAHLLEAIATCPAVVIARVNGHAFGGGAGLVAAADIAVMSPSAQVSFSEVKLGLVPATISRYVVPKVGPGQARWLFATGEPFGADVALRIGLVHEVAEDLDAAVERKIGAVLSVGPRAAHACKLLAQDPAQTPEAGATMLAERRATEEAREGISAFLAKRPANFVVKR